MIVIRGPHPGGARPSALARNPVSEATFPPTSLRNAVQGTQGRVQLSHSPQEVPGHRRVGGELTMVQGLRGPVRNGLVHAVLHRQHPHRPGPVLLHQALHQAERQPCQRGPARGEQPEPGAGRKAGLKPQPTSLSELREQPPGSAHVHQRAAEPGPNQVAQRRAVLGLPRDSAGPAAGPALPPFLPGLPLFSTGAYQ